MTPKDRIRRAEMAKQSLEFAAPAFDALTASYMDKIKLIASSSPGDADKITALAQAMRVVEVAREQIELIISDGKEAEAEQDYARRFVDMAASDRRLLGIAPSKWTGKNA